MLEIENRGPNAGRITISRGSNEVLAVVIDDPCGRPVPLEFIEYSVLNIYKAVADGMHKASEEPVLEVVSDESDGQFYIDAEDTLALDASQKYVYEVRVKLVDGGSSVVAFAKFILR